MSLVPNDHTGDVPLRLRVTDPILWLETHDRNPELHETINLLLASSRTAEAVLLLESYIGATAAVRTMVNGWDSWWAMCVTQLVAERQPHNAVLIASILKTTISTPRKVENNGTR